MVNEKALFGAGCFWHVEESFCNVKGVVKTTVGYMGGTMKNPTYEDVCSDKTGYVEVVEVEFDPKVTSYEKLLEVFWTIHDPTQVNRQGADYGTQYKSAIFYFNDEQKQVALKSRDEAAKHFNKPIATIIEKASTFYKAEDYHQKYYQKHGSKVCQV